MAKFNYFMGPAAAPAQPVAAAPKFWNVASVSDDEGEITLYGDVLSERPYDWWTGEPIPGNFITPEGFMDDLALVKDKAKITVKLNSCGGDLYTGIAIHNALKSLTGDVNVIVEGIAASAASVIMCAGDTVTVFPGSLIMIHGVSVYLWDALNIQDMKQLMKAMDASERAVAEIYNGKTGIEVDALRSMMTKETWFTGREAIDKGFANVLKEDENDPTMSMSADKKVLFVNGIRHNIERMHNVPGGIPVNNVTPPAATSAVNNNKPTANAANKEGGHPMTPEELRAAHPEAVAQIEQAAAAAAVAAQTQTTDDAVTAERQRLEAIDSIAASIPNRQLVNDAKYGENRCTAQELCFRVMQQSAASGQAFLANYAQDGQASGAAAVAAAPNGGAPVTAQEQNAADINAVVAAYTNTKGGTK
ncbi:MAG: Clp protease ClpP [Clostridia bacterium]|nr:Clp protease ClpP [Clostridia bacterium]